MRRGQGRQVVVTFFSNLHSAFPSSHDTRRKLGINYADSWRINPSAMDFTLWCQGKYRPSFGYLACWHKKIPPSFMPMDPGVLLPEILTCMLVAPGFTHGPCRSDPIVTLYVIGCSLGDLHLFVKCSKSSISKMINILRTKLSLMLHMHGILTLLLDDKWRGGRPSVFPLIYRVPAP